MPLPADRPGTPPRPRRGRLSALSVEQILGWADAHHARTGEWPKVKSGPVLDAPGESWNAVVVALALGARGLPGGMTLARLLAERRGVRNSRGLPRLNVKQIRAWAEAHRRREGRWPTGRSGAVREAPGETWGAIQTALVQGGRGLPGGSSLSRLLRRAGAGGASMRVVAAANGK